MGHRIGPEERDTWLKDEGSGSRTEEPSLIYFTGKPDTAQIHMRPD